MSSHVTGPVSGNRALDTFACGSWHCTYFGEQFLPTVETCLRESLTEFAAESPGYGEEPGQTGALLDRIHGVFRDRRSRILSSIERTNAAKQIGRYPYFIIRSLSFRSRQEKRLGGDMAFVVVTHIGGVLRCARFTLFQAKLLQPDGNLRIDIRQLNTLLKSNTHASQYIYWNENRAPVVIPALVLDTHLLERFRDTLKRSGERSVQVEHLLPFSWDFSLYFAWNMLGLWSGAEFHDSTTKPPAFGGPIQNDDGDGGPPPELVQILHRQNVPRVLVAYQGISTAVRNPLVDVMTPGPEQIPRQRRRPRI